MPVHVSIHDVSPAWEAEIDLALEACHAVGVRPALLVVPNFHGRSPLNDHPEFAEKLQRLQADGHEIFLHGFFHRAGFGDSSKRSDTSGLRRFFAQKIVSAGEAEFSDVSREEAVRRLDDGERVLKEAGLTIDGFVAPAWSMPKWLVPLLASRGSRFTEDHAYVYDPAEGRSRASMVLNYASRTPARLLSTVAYCRLARPLRRLVPARIAIHPGDMHFNLLRHEVRELLDWAKNDVVPRARNLLA